MPARSLARHQNSVGKHFFQVLSKLCGRVLNLLPKLGGRKILKEFLEPNMF